MKLSSNKSKWILFLPTSAPAPEIRHIYDLAYGWCCLVSKGISESDIFVYIEGSNRGFINSAFDGATGSSGKVKDIAEFYPELGDAKYENLVMFVSGHGNYDGLDSKPPIKPTKIVSSIKAASNLKNAIVYLGQCFAGVFNYLPVGKSKTGGTSEPEIIILGATNLHSSISMQTTEQLNSSKIPWQANLFLLYTFKWISNPVDIDGDGLFTIMDSFKYSGSLSNLANKKIKKQQFVGSFRLHEELIKANDLYTKDQSIQNKLMLDAAIQNYESSLEVRYTQQESWILNANPAQKIELI